MYASDDSMKLVRFLVLVLVVVLVLALLTNAFAAPHPPSSTVAESVEREPRLPRRSLDAG